MNGETDMNAHDPPASTKLWGRILPTLILFAVSSIGYFSSHRRSELGAETRGLLKIIPILFLASFCIFEGRSRSKYRYYVTAGLLASCAGDYFLVWSDEDNFMRGMGAFALAHQLYILAFGFKSLSPVLMISAAISGSSVAMILLPHLKGVLAYGVPCYIVLISCMVWRASARVHPPCEWPSVVGALGALVFAVSDLNLALNAFYFEMPYEGHHTVTMVFYYIGQLCIALSVSDHERLV
ncbi:lysoplasmalogenase-like protein TMEM86A [Galendromus occidentalis]|uniref:lysoplasmalogenase n=1 Tax=Galendromus occidentalis TaxID=34638 RepID=A0AAJ7L697_9ACAR|nr:lysoplasmalogenase-like protein TMEM86A [Galendromus occidentalis]